MQRRWVRRQTRASLLAIGSLIVTALAAPAVAGPVAATPEGRGTLHVLSDIGAVDLDPTAADTSATRSLLSGLVIRSLTQLVYDARSHQMVIEPDLATTLGVHNSTYTRWTFTLQKGVRFENGEPVRPIDIKFGIERSFDRATFPSGPNFSNEYFLHGHTYKGPYRSGADYDGVVIRGQHITLKMARPFPDLPYYLAFPAMSPIPPGRVSSPATYKYHPLATGPYLFRAYTPGHALLLAKNPYWQAATDPHRSQRLASIAVRLDMPPNEIDQTLLRDTGAGRTSISLGSVLPADYRIFESQAPNRLMFGLNRCVDMFDPDNRKITNIAVRRALAWAYPYQAAWAAGGDIRGVTRIPATNLEPPGTVGRTIYNPLPGHAPGATYAAKARAILVAAHQLHAKVEFAYEVDVPTSVALKNVLVLALKNAGFSPQPIATTKKDYVHDFLDNPNAAVNVRAVTTCSAFPTGGSVLVPEFHTTNIDVDGFGSNYSAFSDATVDGHMAKATLAPLHGQGSAWNAIDRLIQQKSFPTVVTGYHGVALMRGSDVQGFAVDDTRGMPTWSTLTIRMSGGTGT